MKKMLAYSFVAIALLFANIANAREFGGYECTVDCSGHAAGYLWAEERNITDERNCPLNANRNSFYEGCLVYVEDPGRGADEDDDGEDID